MNAETPSSTSPNTEPGSAPDGRCTRHGAHRRRGPGWRAVKLLAFLGLLVGVPFAVANAAGHGRHFRMDRVESAAELREKLDRPADWLLDRVDATDAQVDTVHAVLDRAAPEALALKGEHEALRQRLHDALTAPTVNAAEVEAVRHDGLALADDASRVVLGAVVEIAQALDVTRRASGDGNSGPPCGQQGYLPARDSEVERVPLREPRQLGPPVGATPTGGTADVRTDRAEVVVDVAFAAARPYIRKRRPGPKLGSRVRDHMP
jgi:Spy/CpxP family protein refolding chaperone